MRDAVQQGFFPTRSPSLVKAVVYLLDCRCDWTEEPCFRGFDECLDLNLIHCPNLTNDMSSQNKSFTRSDSDLASQVQITEAEGSNLVFCM